VDLHISAHESEEILTVRVAGRLGFVGLEELRRTCRSTRHLRLDLSQLLSADETGTNFLAALHDSGAELVNVPPYIDLLLRIRYGRTS
jgi:hypothetical protein